MNYTKIYNNLIETNRNKNRYKTNGEYYEEHHILPVSWGGTDEAFNLVLLTPEEHWLAHLLLAKIATGQNVYKAHQAIVNMGRVIVEDKRKTSKLYAIARKNISEEISKRHTNTLIVKDAETNIRIGRVSKDHPNVLNGTWVFFHTGMKRSQSFKDKVGKSISGENNGTFCGMNNEHIFNRCKEVFEKYGVWTYTITRYYCKLKYNENIPKSFGKKYRESINVENVKKNLIELYDATPECFDFYAKHQTNRILKEIENEFKN